jgi:prepilin-type N-terminal cleavage/methylation domain-containing protein/prepilin-type processing-associated H-X9-DG protein
MKNTRAFTLIELLVVLAIIIVLAAVLAGVIGPIQRKGQLTQGINRLKQLSTGLLNYTGSHDGEFPLLGQAEPAWGAGNDEITKSAWYNAIPRAAGVKGLSDFQEPINFYAKENPMMIPAGKYPDNKTSRPYFAVALNSRLFPRDVEITTTGSSPVRSQNIVLPARTIVFFEGGLPDEKQIVGQQAYTGKASGWVPDVAARYGDSAKKELSEVLTNICFADGHVESLPAVAIMPNGSSAYFPQLEQHGGSGKVSWTIDPEVNPN